VILLVVFTALSTVFYRQRQGKVLGQRVEAVGGLVFTYPNSPGGPIFDMSDFKPGDCVTKTVHVKNEAITDSSIIVRSADEVDVDSLSTQLSIVISENGYDLYGGEATGGAKLVSDFFVDSDSVNGIKLSEILGNNSETEYDFTVCFNIDSGNEYQKTSTVFDLKFGEIFVPIELPEVCKDLEGIVTKKITGTPGDDKIKGTSANEYIVGLSGNDKIYGKSGHDCIIGGDGNDRIDSGSGNDIVTGDQGKDKIDAGSGNDYVSGGLGDDDLDGGSGKDLIYGDDGEDKIRGGSGDDVIYGGLGDDYIKSGSGADQIRSQAGEDKIKAGSGNDFLDGGFDYDKLNGQSGVDTCVNGEGLDSCEL
jgi:Ca2+-binding RTX toxin-like protein